MRSPRLPRAGGPRGRPARLGQEAPTAFDASTMTPNAGDMMTVSFTVENQGSGTAFGSWLDQLWLSTDQTVDNPGDVFLANVPRMAPLAASGTYDVPSQAVTIPVSRPPGAYFLLLAVDVGNTLFEENNGNNAAAPIPITVN